MADPVLVYNTPYIYFTCDRDPTGTEAVVSGYSIPSTWLFYWWNTTTNNVFRCQNGAASPLVWTQELTPGNILAQILSAGWDVNTNRAYASQSLTLGVARTPSVTNDTLVVCNVTMAIAILQTCTITAQVDSGAGFVTVGQCSLAGAAITSGQSLSFIVPANAQYKIVGAGAGTNTIVSTMELSF